MQKICLGSSSKEFQNDVTWQLGEISKLLSHQGEFAAMCHKQKVYAKQS